MKKTVGNYVGIHNFVLKTQIEKVFRGEMGYLMLYEKKGNRVALVSSGAEIKLDADEVIIEVIK
jgi:hypothetical protein